jgi:CheY-like chemotaxis protein
MQANNKTPAPRRRLNIFVVDDDVDTVLTLAEMLRDEGHIVHTSANPRSAIEAIQRYKPDVCLLDVVMPGKTGFALVREVLAMNLQVRPVLIAISGVFNSQGDELIAKSAGFDHFVRKGTPPSELVGLIDHYARGASGR